MTRRELLAFPAVGIAAPAKPAPSILVHEHVLVDFVGAGEIRPGRYDADEVFRVARPKLEAAARHGCVRLLEATPNYLGRDAKLMRRLAEATGVDIWINTGIYGAGRHRYVPSWARDAGAEELARRWVDEARRGVEGVRPKFIKTGAAALAQIEIVESERVRPSRYVWVHAHTEKDMTWHAKAARAGAWLEFDGLSAKSADWHLECLKNAAAMGFLGQCLLSHDAGWYTPGEPGGGSYRDYTYLYSDFLPRLEPGWLQTLLWDNPRHAYGR